MTEQIQPGTFFIRFVAVFLDGIIFGLLYAPINIVFSMMSASASASEDLGAQAGAMLLNWLLSTLSFLLYAGWFYKHKGATPGKMLLGLRVVDVETGSNIGYGKTFLRETIGKIVSAIVLLIGYLMVIFRPDRRALHDLLAGTQVLRHTRS